MQIVRMGREKESAAQQVQSLLTSLLAAHENASQRVGEWQNAAQDDHDSLYLADTKVKLL